MTSQCMQTCVQCYISVLFLQACKCVTVVPKCFTVQTFTLSCSFCAAVGREEEGMHLHVQGSQWGHQQHTVQPGWKVGGVRQQWLNHKGTSGVGCCQGACRVSLWLHYLHCTLYSYLRYTLFMLQAFSFTPSQPFQKYCRDLWLSQMHSSYIDILCIKQIQIV